jgi:hypothetical protein
MCAHKRETATAFVPSHAHKLCKTVHTWPSMTHPVPLICCQIKGLPHLLCYELLSFISSLRASSLERVEMSHEEKGSTRQKAIWLQCVSVRLKEIGGYKLYLLSCKW